MLSVTILAPILSIIPKIDLTWTLKVVYPILFSMVPLGLYDIFRKQTNSKIAFLSSFIFISFFAYYMEMVALARQEIGEIFLILLVMVMISDELDYMRRSIFFIVFGASLAVSHYGLAYFSFQCIQHPTVHPIFDGEDWISCDIESFICSECCDSSGNL
jgi:uncharacterized membrane protein